MLKVEHLGLAYPGNIVFKDFNLDLQSGNLILIKGPNGSGKTSLLNCIAGIIPHHISADIIGNIMLDNQDITKLTLPERLGLIAYQMVQQFFFFPSLLLEQAFPLENLACRDFDPRLNCVNEYFGLTHLQSLSAADLSYGQQKVASWAIAELTDPSLILLDEPSRGMSDSGCKLLRKWIIDSLKSGRSILCTEHSRLLDDLASSHISLGTE